MRDDIVMSLREEIPDSMQPRDLFLVDVGPCIRDMGASQSKLQNLHQLHMPTLLLLLNESLDCS